MAATPARDGLPCQRLRDWLRLPGDGWPPDYYTLLGLKPGQGSAEDIEARVLERLELLRRYQLSHPEEATEGMNLLARALDTLTDPKARQQYDQSLGLHPAAAAEPPAAVEDDLDELFASIPIVPAAVEETEPTADSPDPDDTIPADEPIVDLEVEEEDIDEEPEILDSWPDILTSPVLPPLARLEDHPAHPAAPPRPRSPRREVYAELARVRRVLRLWEQARPYVINLDRTVENRLDCLALMACLAELRPLLPTVADLIGTGRRPGRLVAEAIRRPLSFAYFADMDIATHYDFVDDFKAAHRRLGGYYDDLRAEAERLRDRSAWRVRVVPILRRFANRPEWILLALAILFFLVATARSH